MNTKFKITSVYIYIILLAYCCLSLFSYTTSPWYNEPSSGDSAIFQTIGKYWVQGYLPYVDLWDQKGPLIFFLNGFGYYLTGNFVGVYLIQLFCFSLTLCIIYHLLRISFSEVDAALLLLLPTLSFSANNLGGNGVEEYLLPLLSVSYICLYKWTCNVREHNLTTHPAKYAFVYGLVLSFSLMTRLTNALGICGATAVIAIWLILHKSWKNLLTNIFAFILGAIALFLPFAIYFHAKGAFDEMWFATFLYNIEYAKISSSQFHTLSEFIKSAVHFSDTWLLLLTSFLIYSFHKERRLAAILWFVVSFLSLLWFLKGLAFAHYGIISLPTIAISILELYEIIKKRKFYHRIMSFKLIISLYTLCVLMSCIHIYSVFRKFYANNQELVVYRNFLREVPAGYKNSFIAYNGSVDFYLYNNIRPATRFFILQDFQASASNTFQSKLRDSFRRGPQWILVKGDAKEIKRILQNKYFLFKSDYHHGIKLYHIRRSFFN